MSTTSAGSSTTAGVVTSPGGPTVLAGHGAAASANAPSVGAPLPPPPASACLPPWALARDGVVLCALTRCCLPQSPAKEAPSTDLAEDAQFFGA
eukprot:COSAG01_NODE_5285_length_4356_cov_44.815833_1_plen_93_part_10